MASGPAPSRRPSRAWAHGPQVLGRSGWAQRWSPHGPDRVHPWPGRASLDAPAAPDTEQHNHTGHLRASVSLLQPLKTQRSTHTGSVWPLCGADSLGPHTPLGTSHPLLDPRGREHSGIGRRPGAPAPRSPGERGQPPALSPAPGREARRPGSAASRAACLLCWCFQLSNQGEVPRTEARGSPSPRLMRALGSGGWGGRKPWDLRGKVAKTLDHPGSRGLCAQGCRSTARSEGSLPLHTREALETEVEALQTPTPGEVVKSNRKQGTAEAGAETPTPTVSLSEPHGPAHVSLTSLPTCSRW